MTNLSNADIKFLTAGIFGAAPQVVSAVPMIRKQGNGNFTGFVRKTYADGLVTNEEFIVNAKSVEAVHSAYAEAA